MGWEKASGNETRDVVWIQNTLATPNTDHSISLAFKLQLSKQNNDKLNQLTLWHLTTKLRDVLIVSFKKIFQKKWYFPWNIVENMPFW